MNHEGFLADILANPADDTPRLVYADWLEENGDEARAEFIREQIELARTGKEDHLWRGGSKRAQALLDAHKDRWVKGLPEWARRNGSFRRGFVSSVRCTVRQFLQGGAALRRLTPLESLRLDRARGALEPLVAAPFLAGLSSLTIANEGLLETDAGLLARCPYLAGLRRLYLPRNAVGPDGGLALAQSPHLANLTELDLLGNQIGEPGARALAWSASLARLT
jgi:uncharacterized protein (TIGR02996 family)